MKWFACDPLIGKPRLPADLPAEVPITSTVGGSASGRKRIGTQAGEWLSSRADLLTEMRRLGIRKALVRHVAALECGPFAGNLTLARETRGAAPLLPVWFLTPDGTEPDFSPDSAVEAMLKAGARAAWTDPEAEGFSLLPWCSGALYEALQARHIPLFLDYLKIKADDLDRVLSDFPGLRLILLNAPRLGRNRLLYPLLRRHPQLYLCLNHTYSVFWGIEDLCRHFGPARWLFGMGYPSAEGGATIAAVMYADIPDAVREAIAHGNLERLLKEVKV